MANIALTNRCNLSCEYCFAHEYTAEDSCDITMDSFLRALDFVRSEGEVGLIGGEPLLHKNINEVLALLISDPQIRRVTLFTNGIYIVHKEEMPITFACQGTCYRIKLFIAKWGSEKDIISRGKLTVFFCY